MSNTYIANGDWKLEEILEELKSGIYLAGSRGGQVSTGEGVFQFNAKKGYIVGTGKRRNCCEMYPYLERSWRRSCMCWRWAMT
jgi:predicted Zn-dependent protease